MKRWHKFRYEFGFWWKGVWEKVIGMRLALWLDKRHPDWCWAELCVNLGLGWDLRNWREGAESIASCQADCARNGSCWCGKLVDEKKMAEFLKPGRAMTDSELENLSDQVAPSKGAEKAAELIALDHPDATDKNLGGMIAAMAEIIDRETKSPQMAAFIRLIAWKAKNGYGPSDIDYWLQTAQAIALELES